ncbi:MAG: hypothetical protein ACKOXG_02565 [Arenimonas sp.]
MHRSVRAALIALTTLLGASILCVPAARAQANAAKVDRMTDLVVELMPIGAIFEDLAKADPQWPLPGNQKSMTSGQHSCLRGELSQAGYRRMKRVDVAEYAAANPSRLDADIRVLEGGAARLMNRLVLAGAEAERTGVPADEQAILSAASIDQIGSFMSLMQSPDYAGLRRMAGLGNAFDADKSKEENEAAGEDIGANLATQAIFKAMSTCKIPASALFAD